MKNYLILIILLFSLKIAAQNDAKTKFQKNKYELAVSYYKKSDFVNALDQFSIASRIKPENEIGQEAIKKVDTLKEILRKEILERVNGTWLMTGDKPIWTVNGNENFKNKEVDEVIEVNDNKILFYEQDRKTKVRKLIKTEDLVYYNMDKSDSLYSAIILSDGSVWNCSIDDKSKVLHIINIARKGQNGVEKITQDNQEVYYKKEL
ncbi:hypothetical protein [Flavobacterium johnsoniae]|uniref:Tetratricopeptide repeat protein n=1 Tax=Flavobacterium johnsoniae TaxID=986 RepID=A0A1J7CQA1_FLAJO|nr:hypothetical protein [Flavobacterium johnsoniae]OIV43696.1 hypothetical protein BKM63_00360 [Flavobacterium johnsoniae]